MLHCLSDAVGDSYERVDTRDFEMVREVSLKTTRELSDKFLKYTTEERQGRRLSDARASIMKFENETHARTSSAKTFESRQPVLVVRDATSFDRFRERLLNVEGKGQQQQTTTMS
jgi:hypothetical protein